MVGQIEKWHTGDPRCLSGGYNSEVNLFLHD